MAITSGAGPGVVVTTAAMNESLGSQTQQTGSNTVVVSDTIVVLSNGNLETSPVYIDRLCIVRQGASNEETRRITADAVGTGTTRILTVNEDWITVPASSDTIHVSYIIQDAATLTGLSLVNKTVQDFNSSRRFTVGTGAATFAYMAFLDGVGLQLDDNGSTTVASFTIESDGRFDCGYLIGGTPTAGCKLQGANGSDGELAFEVISGGEWNCFASYIDGVNRELADFNTSTTSKIKMVGVRWSFIINDILWGVQDTDINGMAFLSDGGGTSPRIRVRDWSTGNEFKNITVNNFDGFESNTSGDDPDLKNTQFIDMSKLLTVATGETWSMINPIWNPDTANQNDISIAGTGEVLEQFELEATTTQVDGTPIIGKNYTIDGTHRGVTSTVLLFEQTADSEGKVIHATEIRRLIDNAGSSLTVEASSEFTHITTQYGFIPASFSFTPENEDEVSESKLFGKRLSFALLPDIFQVETTQATAITLGDDTNIVEIEQQTNPAIILKYVSGTGTLSVGDTIDSTANAWQGTVVDIIEGNSTAGTIILDSTNATAFSDVAQTLDDSPSAGDWSATYTTSSVLEYDWLINADTLTAQQLYDYMNAKADEATLDIASPTFFDDIFLWSNSTTTVIPMLGDSISPNIFRTVRNVPDTTGWAIYGLSGGLGSIKEYISNDGTAFLPVATVTLTVHCERKDDNTDIQSVQIIIKRVSDGSEVDSGITNASGDFTSSFTYTVDVDVTIDARKSTLPIPRFFAEDAANTIVSTGMTQNFLMVEDKIAVQA